MCMYTNNYYCTYSKFVNILNTRTPNSNCTKYCVQKRLEVTHIGIFETIFLRKLFSCDCDPKKG